MTVRRKKLVEEFLCNDCAPNSTKEYNMKPKLLSSRDPNSANLKAPYLYTLEQQRQKNNTNMHIINNHKMHCSPKNHTDQLTLI